eukprot:364833-Chlamydomonas_euryale.AAC.11
MLATVPVVVFASPPHRAPLVPAPNARACLAMMRAIHTFTPRLDRMCRWCLCQTHMRAYAVLGSLLPHDHVHGHARGARSHPAAVQVPRRQGGRVRHVLAGGSARVRPAAGKWCQPSSRPDEGLLFAMIVIWWQTADGIASGKAGATCTRWSVEVAY